MISTPEQEQALMTELWDPAITDDPEAFVLFAYPWGKQGTPLERHKEPRVWQRDVLQEMAQHIKDQKEAMATGELPKKWQEATASGRGIGKSALVSWLSDWMMTTKLGGTTIVTANTETQLRTKTFPEIKKWTTMLINAHWFEVTGLSVKPDKWYEQLLKTQLKIDTGYYYCQGLTWSEEEPDAFAGAHNMSGIMLIYDEASGIPKPIWDVSEGFFTEPILNRFWNVYSNPRRNSGAFFDTFNKNSAYWRLRKIDARTVEGTDPAVYEEIIDKNGEDSDEAKIEVYGEFPAQGEQQFISRDLVTDAQRRELQIDISAPLVIGVDIARKGSASTVFRFRQGRDARSIPPVRLRNKDNMYVANELAMWIDKTDPDGVFIDAGNGTGVIDRLKEMGYKRIHEVWFGSDPRDVKRWANKRIEMYDDLRKWLSGGMIDNSKDLERDLTSIEWKEYGRNRDKKVLESKDEMKQRGVPSTDDGDALVLTFAEKVARRDKSQYKYNRRPRIAEGVDYNPLA